MFKFMFIVFNCFAGFAAGAHTYSDDWGGGGVDYMCLPPNPDYDKYDMKNDTIAHSWVRDINPLN